MLVCADPLGVPAREGCRMSCLLRIEASLKDEDDECDESVAGGEGVLDRSVLRVTPRKSGTANGRWCRVGVTACSVDERREV